MLTTLLFASIALGGGVLVGWLLGGRRVQRAEVGRAVAESRLAQLERSRTDMANTFAALAQQAFKNASESLVQMNKTQVDGSLETKRAEIEGLLTPVREMLDQYRGELVKSEHSRNEAYGGLQQQVLALLSAQQSAQREAARLANA